MTKYPKDLCGERFGRLTAIYKTDAPSNLKKRKNNRTNYWFCICDCGGEKIVERYSLTTKKGTKSCGCLLSEAGSSKKGMKYNKSNKKYYFKNGYSNSSKSRTRFYGIWSGMKYRCLNPENISYGRYGAKGIKICDRWLIFENFQEDMYASYLEFSNINGKDTATLDRIDSNGDYEPSNCRWATYHTQSRNTNRTIKPIVGGIEYESIVDLAIAYDIHPTTIQYRYKIGKRDDELVKKPNYNKKQK